MPPLFPLLLAVHVTLAVALFLPSILLPFALRGARGAAAGRGPVPPDAASLGPTTRLLLELQSRGTVVVGLGLALTGLALVALLGVRVVEQPWLLLALTIYAANLLLAFFVQRPNLRRLIGLGGGDDATWRVRARRQRYVSYAMAGLTGLIAFLMSTKPALW